MKTSPTFELVQDLSCGKFAEYLIASGWIHVQSSRDSWMVFQGPPDFYGEALEIVLSKKPDSRTTHEYFVAAVNLLAELRNEPVDIVVQRIVSVNQDVINIRNLDTDSKASISIQLAARQISRLHTLIKYATLSESDALPHYRSNYSTAQSNRMVNQFQFAHTKRRSFGFVVQTPNLPEPVYYRQLGFDFKSEVEVMEPLAPIERRITERIIRGLVKTKQAVKQQSVEQLVHSFHSGFNGNMCNAIIDISPKKSPNVEYSILWSPKINPPSDINEPGNIILNETDYAFLDHAAAKMRILEPSKETFFVRGLVTQISSDDDPSKPTANRSVVLAWNNKPDTTRVVGIMVDLSLEDYLKAVEAHKEWLAVGVEGEARLVGNRWRLINPRNFRVL